MPAITDKSQRPALRQDGATSHKAVAGGGVAAGAAALIAALLGSGVIDPDGTLAVVLTSVGAAIPSGLVVFGAVRQVVNYIKESWD